MWTRIYHHKWFPRICYTKYDGGKESGVTGFMLIEWKPVVSIGLLHFNTGSREAYHSHAFNAITWWIIGDVTEETYAERIRKRFIPSFKPKITRRGKVHKVIAHCDTLAFTIRGPWKDTWFEMRGEKKVTLTHGRRVV